MNHVAYLMDKTHIIEDALSAEVGSIDQLIRRAAAANQVVVLVPRERIEQQTYLNTEPVSAVEYVPGMAYPAWMVRLIGLNVLRPTQRSATLVAATAHGIKLVSPGDWLIDRHDTVEVYRAADIATLNLGDALHLLTPQFVPHT